MSKLLYWITIGVLYPLSWLPFKLLYLISDISFVLVYYVIRYRRRVVAVNLKNAFPQKSTHEVRLIERKFYRSFCDIIVENIKFLSISEHELESRFRFINKEVVDDLYAQRKSAITTLGHCGNWEMAGLGASHMVGHKGMAIYRPLKNKHFDKLARNMRGRFGMELVPQNNIRSMLKKLREDAHLFHFITDQTPSHKIDNHWTIFLNQETPVFIGTERVAQMTNLPVLYCHILREKRGHYSLELKWVTEVPKDLPPGELSERHTRLLEANIREQPESWLWSHRRWKHKRPEGMSLYGKG